MTRPVIVAVAPNGARRTAADHPALPITPRDLGLAAARCREAGAAMIHLHVRDDAGRHSLDADRYRSAIAAVRRQAGPEMICQVTTESGGRYGAAEQIAAVRDLAPDAFSVALRELFAEPRDEAPGAAFLAEQAAAGVLVQHILYDPDDVGRFETLVMRGLIPTSCAGVLFVLGRYAVDQRSAPADLLPFLRAWQEAGPLDLPWAVCAFGPREAACMVAAAALGGDVRIGFENNLWRADGSMARDNAGQIAAFRAIAESLGLAVADPVAARALLGRSGARQTA